MHASSMLFICTLRGAERTYFQVLAVGRDIKKFSETSLNEKFENILTEYII